MLKQTNYSVISDSLIYYGFAYTPGIFTYNFDKGVSRSFPVDERIAPRAEPIKTKEPVFAVMNDHAIQSPMYWQPLVTSEYIVQIYQKGQGLTNKKGSYNNFRDKSWQYLVYSKDYTFIESLDLEMGPYFRDTWFVYNDEIFLNPDPFKFKGKSHDMTSLIFHRIKIYE